MKKLFILLFFILIATGYSFGGKNYEPGDIIKPTCSSSSSFVSFFNVNIYGDPILNFQYWMNLDQAVNANCELTISVKAKGNGCTYSYSKTISSVSNKLDLSGSYISNIQTPIGSSGFDYTIKIVSPCVYDNYMSMYVRITWTKTVDYLATNKLDFGFGQKSPCPTGGSGGSGGFGSTGNHGIVVAYLMLCDENALIQY